MIYFMNVSFVLTPCSYVLQQHKHTISCFICAQALGVGRDDTFSVTMLAHAIEQYICEMSPCEGRYSAILVEWWTPPDDVGHDLHIFSIRIDKARL